MVLQKVRYREISRATTEYFHLSLVYISVRLRPTGVCICTQILDVWVSDIPVVRPGTYNHDANSWSICPTKLRFKLLLGWRHTWWLWRARDWKIDLFDFLGGWLEGGLVTGIYKLLSVVHCTMKVIVIEYTYIVYVMNQKCYVNWL